jgi:hypothetical protein
MRQSTFKRGEFVSDDKRFPRNARGERIVHDDKRMVLMPGENGIDAPGKHKPGDLYAEFFQSKRSNSLPGICWRAL